MRCISYVRIGDSVGWGAGAGYGEGHGVTLGDGLYTVVVGVACWICACGHVCPCIAVLPVPAVSFLDTFLLATVYSPVHDFTRYVSRYCSRDSRRH